MFEAESLRDFRPADNKWSVRGWHIAGIASAILAGLLTPVWLFALVTHYVLIAGMWAMPATLLAALALATCGVNTALYRRFGSLLSRRGIWVSGLCLLVIGAQWIVLALWRWEGDCF